MAGQELMLTVPTCKVGRDKLILDVSPDNSSDWRSRHWRTLQAAYVKSPYGGMMLDALRPVYTDEMITGLCDLNQSLITRLASCLGIRAQMIRASELKCGGKRTEHLLDICRAIGCNHYISPAGSQEYLEVDGFTRQVAVSLEIQRFVPRAYAQHGSNQFVSHLSVVDVFANLGHDGASAYVLAGNQEQPYGGNK